MFKFEGKNKYIQITDETPLDTLQEFFEKNSAAIVCEGATVKSICTKVDLLSYLVHHVGV